MILGQDPYHGAGQAHGLAFSVREGVAVPPSLVNIYKELADDIEGFRIPQHGYLQYWAEQGVLLLNTVLTVRADRRIPMPHWAGNALPTKWSTKSTKTANTSSSCFGAATRRKKARLSTAAAISSSARRTPRRCPPIAVFSAANTFPAPMPICRKTG